MKMLRAVALSTLGCLPLIVAAGAHSVTAAIAASSSPHSGLGDSGSQAEIVLASAVAPPEELDIDVLEPFFESWKIGQANFYQSLAMSIYSSQEPLNLWETETLYRQLLELESALILNNFYDAELSYEVLDQFIRTDFGIWGLEPGCVAECTQSAFRLDVNTFQSLSQKSNTTADDDFFALLERYYGIEQLEAEFEESYPLTLYRGEIVASPIFFRYTWDYGGHSLLGSGRHLELLLEIDRYREQHGEYLMRSPLTTFTQQLETMRHGILRDILVVADCSGLEQTEIVDELTQILDQVELNTTEKQALTERIDAFKAASDPIQTNCQEFGTCTCEGG
ncbi:MAG: hypothetical protein AAF728_06095 [Cyanobacteria bacterium P01_D01_bin.128]